MTPPLRNAGRTAGPHALRLSRLGPFAYLGALFALACLVLGLFRGLLALDFIERLRPVPGAWWLFPLGARMDSVTASYLLAPATLLLLVLPPGLLRRARRPLALYFAGTLTLLVVMEAISFDYIAEYDARPNRLFVESLGGSPEVVATILERYGLHVLGVLALAGLAFAATWRLGAFLSPAASAWTLPRRLIALSCFAPVLFLGLRGTLDHRPINASSVAFSSSNLANQLALNSTFTALQAAYATHYERSAADLYGRMPEEEILERVGRYLTFPERERLQGEIPFLHVQRPATPRERPRNLVIVLEESLGAEFVGCLGGRPLTPNLDRLAREGLLFTRLYSTGTRTVRGIEAVVAGFLPTPGSSVVKLGLAQSGFCTIAALLRAEGYATDFVYGGESQFDNMAAFFLGNGFERALDESDFEAPAFRGTWGVSDEDLMRKAHELFVAHGDRPFCALILTTSNHSPYEFPDGRIELHGAEKATRDHTVEYADYALGELFRLAREGAYFRDTDWLVVADHDERTYGDDLIPVSKFHIPGLMLGPDFPPGRYDRVASQIDLVPTLLSVLGVETCHPMIGRDLLALAPEDPGRAILQFHDTHGFLVGERIAVHPGSAEASCFEFRDGRLVPAERDAELLRDGRAHALLPELLYSTRRYRLRP